MINLDFRDVGSFEEIQSRFISIAMEISSKYDIELQHRNGERLQITSLELYLYKPSDWEDPTTHGKRYGFRDQLTAGRWYLHRRKNHSVGAPNRMGIDITAGAACHEIHAGLLVRGVNEIDGPAQAVNSILFGMQSFTKPRNWGYSPEEKIFLQEKVDGKSIYSGDVALVKALNPRQCDCYIGERIGLRKSKQRVDDRYLDSGLRFATHRGSGLKFCKE